VRAEVISIGDELTSGQRLDTNSQWLSQQLGDLGVRVLFHSTVADDLDANIQVFRNAIERAEVIVATGGLGPTEDDLTRQALAGATGRELQLDPDSLAHIENLFRKRQREMPPANRVQAYFPRGSQAIPNQEGTAPGIYLRIPRPDKTDVHFFALPGVPAEMRLLWRDTVRPTLQREWGMQGKLIRHHVIHTFGAGESDVERMLPGLIARGRIPQVGITASKATISLRITAMAASQEDCDALIRPTAEWIREKLGNLIFGEGEIELEQVVLDHLSRRGETLYVQETHTAGLVSHWFARWHAAAFRGASILVLPPDRAADDSLNMAGPPVDTTSEAVEHARLAQSEQATDWALVIGRLGTGSQAADQAGGPPRFPVAACYRGRCWSTSFAYSGHPDLLQIRAAKQAVNWLRLLLEDPSQVERTAALHGPARNFGIAR